MRKSWKHGNALGSEPHESSRGIRDTHERVIRRAKEMGFVGIWIAFKNISEVNPRRMLWANDFPHSDSSWPNSQELLAKHAADISEQERRWIVHDNTKELFQLPCP